MRETISYGPRRSPEESGMGVNQLSLPHEGEDRGRIRARLKVIHFGGLVRTQKLHFLSPPARPLRAIMSQPTQEAGKYEIELIWLQSSELSNGSDVRIGGNALSEERSRSQETDLDGDFVRRAAEAGCVGNDGHQRPIDISVLHANN